MPQKSEREHEIAAIIATLLILYPQSNESPAAREAIAAVWLEDFTEFDPEIVDSAVREWRRSHKWRPSIAELRAICIEGQATANWKRERALPKPAATPEPWMAALWPEGMEARSAAIEADKERFRKAEQWRQERETAK